MPLIETKGAASSQGFGQFAQTTAANYIEDVFSTYLYTGNSTTGGNQTITNGINLSGKGGLVWIKGRNKATNNALFDTVRGSGTSGAGNRGLSSNLTSSQGLGGTSDYLSLFDTNGFRVTQAGALTAAQATNYDGNTYASWTFRNQPKFFDIVTYTGTGANRTVPHNLGSVPGCIIIKRIDSNSDWQVYHRSLANTEYVVLNTNNSKATGATRWNSTTPTSTVFSLGTDASVNSNGALYIAYIFAHDAGGFGLTGSDNVISCGSYTGNGSTTGPTVSLGYEPQWLMIKSVSFTGSWNIFDNMRGMYVGGEDNYLYANSNNFELPGERVSPNATGFSITSTSGEVNTDTGIYIYIAIRRGPMKTPTSGTSVFAPVAYTGTGGTPPTLTTNFPVDLVMWRDLTSTTSLAPYNSAFFDRLRSNTSSLTSSSSSTENVIWNDTFFRFDSNTTLWLTDASTFLNSTSKGYVTHNLLRAPGFFDTVCYTGTGANATFSHNLKAVPELMIVKARNNAVNWVVYAASEGAGKAMYLNSLTASFAAATFWNSTTPTSSVFSVGTSTATNGSGTNYVAYLFASCPGVSKVGSYTGSGTTKQIDCGFTGGARFVLIKRTDSTGGNWYVWDSARGIVAGNDPYLLLNGSAAEVTGTDYVDTYSAGFEISSTAPAAINASGGTFIFLAIA